MCESGVNDVMLSVDAFHQETIPLELVLHFASALVFCGMPAFRVHPAWVVNKENDNPYNAETKRLLQIFIEKGIPVSNGNNIFFSGNAAIHLAGFYPSHEKLDITAPCGSAPYTSRLDEIDCLSLNPNGSVETCMKIGNLFENDLASIIKNYNPYVNPISQTILSGGVGELIKYAQEKGIKTDISSCRSVCAVCKKIVKQLT